MKATSPCFHLLLSLGLFVASCDKPDKPSTKSPSQAPASSRLKKSDRSPENKPPATRAGLRQAMEDAEQQPTQEERDQALSAVITDAMDLDPELAREALGKLTTGSEERNNMIGHFAMRLAEQDPESAAAWAKSLATDEDRSLAFGKIALVLSATDPTAAAKLLSDSGVASRNFDVAVVQVIQRWAADSPTDAAAWVVQFDQGEARAAGLKEISAAWVTKDAGAAFAWISGIQDQAIREEAANGMAEAILELPEEDQQRILVSASSDIRTRFEALKTEADDEEEE